LAAAFAVDPARLPEPVTVHEWGTFTSVASETGAPVRWAPLSGPADLPCFVERLSSVNIKGLAGMVRMETPVLYFYAQRPTTLSVAVDFPKGWITEWYPQATSNKPGPAGLTPPIAYHNGRIEWNNVEVHPGANPALPTSKSASHYYAARDTDAAPIRIGKQWEKLIFYRGIADFNVTVRPSFTAEGRLQIHNTGSEPIPLAILFENRGGKIGFQSARSVKDVVELNPPEVTSNAEAIHHLLADSLVEFGLYRKEALAMIETWRDSWFEEGMRVFYIVPRPSVDAILPLTVTPPPASTARVFVGRVEVLSPAMRQTIETAVAANDSRTLTRLGRFLSPFVSQIERTTGRRLMAHALQEAHSNVYRELLSQACVQ
jgi:hypothetical protein